MAGIKYPVLNKEARDFWEWCEARNIWVVASYINSRDNWEADRKSRRLPDDTEWALKLTDFNKIVFNFGLPDIDLFATSLNTKCRRFVSWFPDHNAYAVDAFTICWNELILRVLNKVILDKAEGILVIPYWNTQPWFPIFKKLVIGNFFRTEFLFCYFM